MRIVHIVGNRPQFIKLAPVSRTVQRRGHEEIIIHTGQHYDENMSDIFFKELEIPRPTKNLEIGSGSHAEMTASAMVGIEKELIKIRPDAVILYGDTDSTVAGAMATSKLNIPICHVEAGTRTFSRTNPEEKNRIVTDHLSDILCAADKESYNNLVKEGLESRAILTGDVMYDSFLTYGDKDSEKILNKYGIEDNEYILMTWHRQENTTDIRRINLILSLVSKLNKKIILPLHPRTKSVLIKLGLWDTVLEICNLKICEPVGYIENVTLLKHSQGILTDSGGLSKESYFANRPCFFMVDLVVWPCLESINQIIHLKLTDNETILKEVKLMDDTMKHHASIRDDVTKKNELVKEKINFFGDGHASELILDGIEGRLQ